MAEAELTSKSDLHFGSIGELAARGKQHRVVRLFLKTHGRFGQQTNSLPHCLLVRRQNAGLERVRT